MCNNAYCLNYVLIVPLDSWAALFRWDGTMDYAVEMLTVLINAWGIECRDELLGHSIRFASTLVDRLDFSVAVANDSVCIPSDVLECIMESERHHYH